MHSQGELNLSSRLLRSIARTDCSSMPRIYVAGSGWVAMVVVGVAGLMLAVIFGKHRSSQQKRDDKNYKRETVEMNDEVSNDNKIVHSADCSESVPIMHNINKENTF